MFWLESTTAFFIVLESVVGVELCENRDVSGDFRL